MLQQPKTLSVHPLLHSRKPMMKTIRTSPVLRSRAKTGKAKYWMLRLLTDGAHFYIQAVWWQEGGSQQASTPERVEGKNVGRSNATSDREQAELAFTRTVQKRRDKGFSEDGSAAHVYTKPMLAHKFDASRVQFPVFVQPKLDGFRMLMDGETAWTRGGKDHVRECVQHLLWDTGEYTVDGELLLPGNLPLQVTASAAKKYQRGVSETLQYHVYDLVEPDLPFSKRIELLAALVESGAPRNVKLVPTVLVESEAAVLTAHGVFTDYGYEGSIIRAATGRYEIGYRSHGLLKLKDFQDAEYRVVGVEHGKGSFADKAILVLEAKEGVTFNAVPMGDEDYRRWLWRERDSLLGQMWTVRYQSLSREGKPIFPVAVAPRDNGD